MVVVVKPAAIIQTGPFFLAADHVRDVVQQHRHWGITKPSRQFRLIHFA
jgi:hypothetical protein